MNPIHNLFKPLSLKEIKQLLCASLAFNVFTGQSTTKNNFLKNLVISHKSHTTKWATNREKLWKKTILVLILHFRGLFVDNKKLQWWIANHKLLVFWLIHYWNWSFYQTRIFSHFSLDGPVQWCPEKAILIQIKFFGWGKGFMSYCIKNRPWNLKEAFSEGWAICKPSAILGS